MTSFVIGMYFLNSLWIYYDAGCCSNHLC